MEPGTKIRKKNAAHLLIKRKGNKGGKIKLLDSGMGELIKGRVPEIRKFIWLTLQPTGSKRWGASKKGFSEKRSRTGEGREGNSRKRKLTVVYPGARSPEAEEAGG